MRLTFRAGAKRICHANSDILRVAAGGPAVFAVLKVEIFGSAASDALADTSPADAGDTPCCVLTVGERERGHHINTATQAHNTHGRTHKQVEGNKTTWI